MALPHSLSVYLCFVLTFFSLCLILFISKNCLVCCMKFNKFNVLFCCVFCSPNQATDANSSLRNKTRTPNIFQNIEPSLVSPTPSSIMKFNDSNAPLSPNSTTSPNTKSMMAQKLQTLKQRKLDLDKLLIEKNNLLQQLCREEAKLIERSTYSLADCGGSSSGVDCSDGNNTVDHLSGTNNNSTLRRRVDTGFKLPENLLNSNSDDVNQLMLSKKIQQQISQASMKLANDVSQNKVSSNQF